MCQERGLVRAIGRWSLAALMLNGVVGASIFGVPSLVAGYLGRFSPLAYMVAAVGISAIAACLAEVGSQFREAGGPYLYARVAFGPFVALQVGWLSWLTRIAAAAGIAEVFVSYLAQFFPSAESPVVRAAALAALISLLAFINYRGVRSGTRLSNAFTAAKVVVIGTFIGAGAWAVLAHPEVRVIPPEIRVTARDWVEAVLLLVNSFAGFEGALFASGEVRNPREDTPVALLVSLATATFLFIAVQSLVVYTLPSSATSSAPMAQAAQRFLGPVGALLISIGAVICTYGSLSAHLLTTPRITFSMGAQGDFPRLFAAVHPRFRTPYISIVALVVPLIVFAVAGNLRWNSMLSSVSRLFVFACIALALPVLRKKQPEADAFRLPAAKVFVAVALLFTGILLTRISFSGFVVLGCTLVLGFVNWVWVTRYPRSLGMRSAEQAFGED